ncbi:MAG TPA: hypothetical protein VGH38_01780 [Bryobacteraceae bacterium]
MSHKIKKTGLLAMAALAAAMVFTARPADARVRFGVTIAPPVYSYPATPYVAPYAYTDPYAGQNAYPDPNTYVDPYAYPAPVYTYPAPAYVAPYFSFGFGGGDRHEFREHGHYEGHGEVFRGHESFRGGHRR